MKKRSFTDLISGAVLGGALAIGGVAWAHSDGDGGMMGMHKMMQQCSQMMESMGDHERGAGNPDS